jgi:hypothetical protein
MKWFVAVSVWMLLPVAAFGQQGAPTPQFPAMKPGGGVAIQSTPRIDLTAGKTVTVQVRCLGMRDGSLKNCQAIGSEPKNEVAEHLAIQITEQRRGAPPPDWPAEGKWIVLPIILGEPHRVQN